MNRHRVIPNSTEDFLLGRAPVRRPPAGKLDDALRLDAMMGAFAVCLEQSGTRTTPLHLTVLAGVHGFHTSTVTEALGNSGGPKLQRGLRGDACRSHLTARFTEDPLIVQPPRAMDVVAVVAVRPPAPPVLHSRRRRPRVDNRADRGMHPCSSVGTFMTSSIRPTPTGYGLSARLCCRDAPLGGGSTGGRCPLRSRCRTQGSSRLDRETEWERTKGGPCSRHGPPFSSGQEY